MKKAKKALSVIAAAGLLTMSGCSGLGIASDGDSLLHPPRPTGDKAAIQDIISKEAGGSYNLKYPQKGENRSAIILKNENTENEYAIALYSTENDTKLNVSIIVYNKGDWKCVGTYTQNSSGVDRVLFCDINADKRDEIIIGWTSYNSSHKSLTAYSFDSDEVYEMNIDQTYDELAVTDMTADSVDDIVLLSLSTQETPSVATLLQYSDQDKRPVGKYSMELDSEVMAFSNIAVGDIAVNTELKPSEIKVTASGARAENTSKASHDEKSVPESAVSKEEGSGESSAESEVSGEASPEESKTSAEESTKESTSSAEENSKSAGEDPSSAEESVSSASKPETASVPEEESGSESSEPDKKPVPKPYDGKLSSKGIVIDGKRSDNTFCTQIVYYDALSDELIDPIVQRKEGGYVNPTQRTEAVFSRDINGDGIIEYPVSEQMSASADESGASVCNLTAWMNYDARLGKSAVSLNTVMNLKDGYYFVMPERWVGTVTARSYAETREMTFFIWNTKTLSTGDKLLTISRFNEQQWKESDHSGLIPLDLYSKKSKAVYAAQIFLTSADDALNITAQELQDSVYLN